MTESQGAVVIFLVQVGAYAVCFLSGLLSWFAFLYGARSRWGLFVVAFLCVTSARADVVDDAFVGKSFTVSSRYGVMTLSYGTVFAGDSYNGFAFYGSNFDGNSARACLCIVWVLIRGRGVRGCRMIRLGATITGSLGASERGRVSMGWVRWRGRLVGRWFRRAFRRRLLESCWVGLCGVWW